MDGYEAKGSGVEVRDMQPEDDAALLAINNAAVPHVTALEADGFAWIRGHSDYARLAQRGSHAQGFVLAMRNGTPYWSENYAWFGARYESFLYLDRVVVAAGARGSGVGRALYEDVVRFATGRWPRITLEVNVRPPNPASIAFHAAMGYRRVGTRAYEGGEVAMFEREL